MALRLPAVQLQRRRPAPGRPAQEDQRLPAIESRARQPRFPRPRRARQSEDGASGNPTLEEAFSRSLGANFPDFQVELELTWRFPPCFNSQQLFDRRCKIRFSVVEALSCGGAAKQGSLSDDSAAKTVQKWRTPARPFHRLSRFPGFCPAKRVQFRFKNLDVFSEAHHLKYLPVVRREAAGKKGALGVNHFGDQ